MTTTTLATDEVGGEGVEKLRGSVAEEARRAGERRGGQRVGFCEREVDDIAKSAGEEEQEELLSERWCERTTQVTDGRRYIFYFWCRVVT